MELFREGGNPYMVGGNQTKSPKMVNFRAFL